MTFNLSSGIKRVGSNHFVLKWWKSIDKKWAKIKYGIMLTL